MKSRSPGQRWKQTIGLAVVLLLLVGVFSTIPVVRDWQLLLSDTFFRVIPPPKQHSEVVLVLIDDQSLGEYGRWPWPRPLLAQLTRKLAEAGAGVIGLDILLSEAQSPDADKVLSDALRATQRAVIVDKIGYLPDGPHWIEPLPEFAEASRAVGHAHAVLDVDGVCRRFPARELSIDGPRWAFAVEVARHMNPQATSRFLASFGLLLDDAAGINIAKPELIRIPYRRDNFTTVSASAVLGHFDPAQVRGKPVLVGFGPTEIGDRLSTPLTTEFPEAGVTVHAQILDGILTGRTLRQLSFASTSLVLLVTCVVVVLGLRRWRGWAAIAIFLTLAGAAYMIAVLTLMWSSRILPAGSMLLAVLTGPMLVYTADFVVVERSVTHQLLGLRSWLARRGKVSDHSAELSWKLELLQNLQTELGSLYELHKTLLESTQDLVAIFNDRGTFLLSNRLFAQAYGLSSDSAFTLEEARARLHIPADKAMEGHEAEVYLDQELYALRTVPLPPTTVSPGGGTIVTLTSLRTRTERDRARSEALGFITHELRTPLASIQGFAELMMRYPGSPSSSRAPETIFRESKRLLALISSYLDVLRLDAGAKSVRSDIIEIDGIIDQVFDILQPLADAAAMRLVFESKSQAPLVGDAPLIAGAVLNLVSNAIKYGKPGTEIRVQCSREQAGVVIGVQNQGEAIASEDIPRLFDPYYRASNVEAGKTGWGLGLAFVKRIVEKHGGRVGVRSEAGGNCFEIHLPIKARVELAEKETV